jgi:hypothetical protein
MSRPLPGTICGLNYGALSAASMLPLTFEHKAAARHGAFLNRFADGFVTGAARLPLSCRAQALIFGLLLSLPDAIITKTYAPITGLGAIGGLLIASPSASGEIRRDSLCLTGSPRRCFLTGSC